jgi:hypothetical protein
VKVALRILSCAFLCSVSVFGQSVAVTDPPKPKCDSYSMQTLPRDGFRLEQRVCYWRGELFTGSAVFGAAFFGAIGEWRHEPPEWPQGLDGFGRQMGTRYTQGMVKSTATFIVSTITREDPRPHPPAVTGSDSYSFGCQPSTSLKGRLGQSLLRVVWDTCEDGWHRPKPGRLVGSFASGFVGLTWAPPSQDNISSALTSSGTAFGGYVGNSVFSEFQPDLSRLLGKIFPTGKPTP